MCVSVWRDARAIVLTHANLISTAEQLAADQERRRTQYAVFLCWHAGGHAKRDVPPDSPMAAHVEPLPHASDEELRAIDCAAAMINTSPKSDVYDQDYRA